MFSLGHCKPLLPQMNSHKCSAVQYIEEAYRSGFPKRTPFKNSATAVQNWLLEYFSQMHF